MKTLTDAQTQDCMANHYALTTTTTINSAGTASEWLGLQHLPQRTSLPSDISLRSKKQDKPTSSTPQLMKPCGTSCVTSKRNAHAALSRKLSLTCGMTAVYLLKSSLITPPSYGEQKMINPRSRSPAQASTADLLGQMVACLNTPCSEYYATTCQVKSSFTSEAQIT